MRFRFFMWERVTVHSLPPFDAREAVIRDRFTSHGGVVKMYRVEFATDGYPVPLPGLWEFRESELTRDGHDRRFVGTGEGSHRLTPS